MGTSLNDISIEADTDALTDALDTLREQFQAQLRDSIEQGIFASAITDEPLRRKKRRKAKPAPVLPTRRAMRLTGDLL